MSSAPNFNHLARLYRWLEYATFGPALSRTRCFFLTQIAQTHPALGNALVLGDGDGRFTASLLRANPHIRIDAVDASPAMLEALLHRASHHAFRVTTHLVDARSFSPPNPPYDLIVTHFFLDCLSTAEVQSLAATLRASSSPNALWLVSEFTVPPTRLGRLIATPLVHLLYRAFGLLTGLEQRTLPDHHSALSQSGFVLLSHQPRLAGLLISELWSANSTSAPPRSILPT